MRSKGLYLLCFQELEDPLIFFRGGTDPVFSGPVRRFCKTIGPFAEA